MSHREKPVYMPLLDHHNPAKEKPSLIHRFSAVSSQLQAPGLAGPLVASSDRVLHLVGVHTMCTTSASYFYREQGWGRPFYHLRHFLNTWWNAVLTISDTILEPNVKVLGSASQKGPVVSPLGPSLLLCLKMPPPFKSLRWLLTPGCQPQCVWERSEIRGELSLSRASVVLTLQREEEPAAAFYTIGFNHCHYLVVTASLAGQSPTMASCASRGGPVCTWHVRSELFQLPQRMNPFSLENVFIC